MLAGLPPLKDLQAQHAEQQQKLQDLTNQYSELVNAPLIDLSNKKDVFILGLIVLAYFWVKK